MSLEKYKIKPVEYGHWVDSRRCPGRELSTQESYDLLLGDIKLANRLGFTVLRTKLGVIDDDLTPVTNWREFISTFTALQGVLWRGSCDTVKDHKQSSTPQTKRTAR